uniref:Uncharacterized protein n=1 Tax=Anguilla anguilla TaxID=7936 RepID=A0A0E9SN75_ANGAN
MSGNTRLKRQDGFLIFPFSPNFYHNEVSNKEQRKCPEMSP